MLSESNDVASSQQENVHQTYVIEQLADVELQPSRYKNQVATLFSDTHRQVAQTNEKCINKLATCFKFIPGSHGQCVVKPHTAQSLYQILINYDPCQCLRKHR